MSRFIEGVHPRALLRRQQVQALTGLARSTIYKLISQGDFPPPIQLTAKSVAWPSDAISAWIDSRVTAVKATTV
jgi:prophage regulatory protein